MELAELEVTVVLFRLLVAVVELVAAWGAVCCTLLWMGEGVGMAELLVEEGGEVFTSCSGMMITEVPLLVSDSLWGVHKESLRKINVGR